MEVQLHEFWTRELDLTSCTERFLFGEGFRPVRLDMKECVARSRPEGSGKENTSCLSWIQILTAPSCRSIFSIFTESVYSNALRALYTRIAYDCENYLYENWTMCCHLKEAKILHTVMLYAVWCTVKRLSNPCFWRRAKKSFLAFLDKWIDGHFWGQ